jgi:hypothetical protein
MSPGTTTGPFTLMVTGSDVVLFGCGDQTAWSGLPLEA